MGSLSDIHNFGDWRRFRAWILAGATALVGAQLLQAGGIVALDKSMYLAAANINWAGHILGGLIFGFGMVFTGGCPSRNLARAGSGDLRSLLVLVVMGLFAYMAIRGVLAPAARRARAGDELCLVRPRASAASWPGPAGLASATGSMRRRGPARRRRPRLLLRQQELPRLGGACLLRARDRPRSSSPAGRSPASPTTTWRPSRCRRSRSPTCAPPGDALQWLVLFTADAHAGLRHGQRVRRARRRLRRRARHGPVPHRHLLRHRRHAAQPRRRGADGRSAA